MITHYASPAVIVRADEPIADCVAKMKQHEVGSVLVVSDDERQKLVGIFTERDLLNRIDLIQTGGFWKQPIRTVMTKKVITLPVSRFHEAADVMLENHFRHLPVVAPGEDGKSPVLVGVISMRDVLRFHRHGEKQVAELARPRGELPVVGIFTSDDRALKLLQTEIAGALPVLFHEYTVEALIAETAAQSMRELSALIVDLDMPSTAEWLKFLRSSSARAREIPPMILLFDPRKHSRQAIAALAKLENADKVTVFSKPIGFLPLVTRLKALAAGA